MVRISPVFQHQIQYFIEFRSHISSLISIFNQIHQRSEPILVNLVKSIINIFVFFQNRDKYIINFMVIQILGNGIIYSLFTEAISYINIFMMNQDIKDLEIPVYQTLFQHSLVIMSRPIDISIMLQEQIGQFDNTFFFMVIIDFLINLSFNYIIIFFL